MKVLELVKLYRKKKYDIKSIILDINNNKINNEKLKFNIFQIYFNYFITKSNITKKNLIKQFIYYTDKREYITLFYKKQKNRDIVCKKCGHNNIKLLYDKSRCVRFLSLPISFGIEVMLLPPK